jgi:hypothetical protein
MRDWWKQRKPAWGLSSQSSGRDLNLISPKIRAGNLPIWALNSIMFWSRNFQEHSVFEHLLEFTSYRVPLSCRRHGTTNVPRPSHHGVPHNAAVLTITGAKQVAEMKLTSRDIPHHYYARSVYCLESNFYNTSTKNAMRKRNPVIHRHYFWCSLNWDRVPYAFIFPQRLGTRLCELRRPARFSRCKELEFYSEQPLLECWKQHGK